MNNIIHEQAREMYKKLLDISIRNIQEHESTVQTLVTEIIRAEEHYRIIKQSDADMLFLKSLHDQP